jgi:REP element-mobilizing transposase RayT
MSDPPAYFLTWHTYGSWLHGHERGSVDDEHRDCGTPFAAPDQKRYTRRASELLHPPVVLDEAQRTAIQAAIIEVCNHRQWTLLALHVRTTHVHAVTVASATPEKVLNDFKAYATRRLRRDGLVASDLRVWSRHGSTRYLWKEPQVSAAVDYAVNRQGEVLKPLPFVATPGAKSEPGA